MKATADIVLIGAGVQGVGLAFHLAKADAGSIVVLEKKHVAAGRTAKSGAMIRPLFSQEIYIRLVLGWSIGSGPHDEMIVLAKPTALTKIDTTKMVQSSTHIHALIPQQSDHHERAAVRNHQNLMHTGCRMKNPPWSFSGREPGRASQSSPGAGISINTNSDERQFTKIDRPPTGHVAH